MVCNFKLPNFESFRDAESVTGSPTRGNEQKVREEPACVSAPRQAGMCAGPRLANRYFVLFGNANALNKRTSTAQWEPTVSVICVITQLADPSVCVCALLNTPVCVFNSNKYHFPEAFPDWDSNRMCFTQLQLVCASSIMSTLNSHLKIHFTFIFGGGEKSQDSFGFHYTLCQEKP